MFLTAAIAAPQVSNVSMSYDGSGTAKITYDLSEDSGIVLLDIKAGGNSIGDAKIAQAVGDVNRKIAPGTGKTIWWSCSKESLGVDDAASLSAVSIFILYFSSTASLRRFTVSDTYLTASGSRKVVSGEVMMKVLPPKSMPGRSARYASARTG